MTRWGIPNGDSKWKVYYYKWFSSIMLETTHWTVDEGPWWASAKGNMDRNSWERKARMRPDTWDAITRWAVDQQQWCSLVKALYATSGMMASLNLAKKTQ